MNEHKFSIPAQLNGEQLRQELGAELVYINDDKLVIVGDLTEAAAKAGIAAHIPAPIAVPTIEEKLAKLGIDSIDLRKHLGLETPVLKKQLGLVP